jgi:phosphoglucomutase
MNIEKNYERWLNSDKVSKEDKEILKKMSEEEKADAFFKDVEFGTAGMRGVLGPGTNRMNVHTVKKATIGFALYLLEKFPDARTRGVAISHDNRHMSREFTYLIAETFNHFGINAYIFDSLRPTPELSFAVRHQNTCGGVMVTASHNPKEYNGYKVYDEFGCQLVPEKISRLVEIISTLPNELEAEEPHNCVRGRTHMFHSTIDDEYVKLVEGISLNPDLDKSDFKIVYTPNHGTSYVNAMRIFKDFKYDVYPVLKQCNPDPDFSNTLSPNPEEKVAYIEPIKLAKEVGAKLVCMTDPDGDRVGLAALDRDGEYVLFTGNESAAMLMDYIFMMRKKKGILSKNGVMYNTIVTSSLGAKIAEHYGVKNEVFLTGFKFIGNQIEHYDEVGGPEFEFGYEESYGCLVAPFVRDKDGLQAILLYCEMALYYDKLGKNLIEVYDDLGKKYGYHEELITSKAFKGPEGQKEMKELMDGLHNNKIEKLGKRRVVKIEDYQKQLSSDIINGKESKINLPKADVVKIYFDDGCSVAIRPSGTEPKCKFYVGALAKEKAASILAAEEINRDLMEYLHIS